MSLRVSQFRGRFPISKSLDREDDSELWAKVFSARAGIYRRGQVVESELLAHMGDDRSQFSGSILGSLHSHSAVHLIR
jgi:hypothetical protein